VRRWSKLYAVPNLIVCPVCNTLHDYLYNSDSKKKSQIKCKNRSHLFQADQYLRKSARLTNPFDKSLITLRFFTAFSAFLLFAYWTNKKSRAHLRHYPSAARLSCLPRPSAFRPLLTKGLALSGIFYNIIDNTKVVNFNNSQIFQIIAFPGNDKTIDSQSKEDREEAWDDAFAGEDGIMIEFYMDTNTGKVRFGGGRSSIYG